MAYRKERFTNNPGFRLWMSAKGSATRRKLSFDITPEDVIIPDLCPVFHVPMIQHTRYTPSLDRIDNTKGYIKDNIQVISKLANVMKQDASKEELEAFAAWINKKN